MRNRSTVIAIALAAALLVFCLFLPNLAAAARSKLDLGKTAVTQAGSVAFEASPKLDLIEKLDLFTNSDSVTLTGGKRFDAASAYGNALAELARINSLHVMAFDLSSPDQMRHDDPEVSFVISPSDPASSMVVWRLTIYDGGGRSVTAAFDDETGKILQLYYRINSADAYNAIYPSKSGAAPAFPVSAEQLSRQMQAYYGLDVSVTNYDVISSLGYYTVQAKSGDQDMAAFGIIGANGFSINENHARTT